MNQEQFISMVARWKGTPATDEWKTIQKLASDLTVQNVRNVVDGDPPYFKILDDPEKAIEDSVIFGQSWYAPDHRPRQPQR